MAIQLGPQTHFNDCVVTLQLEELKIDHASIGVVFFLAKNSCICKA
jgi:hypothetical protein